MNSTEMVYWLRKLESNETWFPTKVIDRPKVRVFFTKT